MTQTVYGNQIVDNLIEGFRKKDPRSLNVLLEVLEDETLNQHWRYVICAMLESNIPLSPEVKAWIEANPGPVKNALKYLKGPLAKGQIGH